MRNQEPRTDKSDWSVQTSYALINRILVSLELHISTVCE